MHEYFFLNQDCWQLFDRGLFTQPGCIYCCYSKHVPIIIFCWKATYFYKTPIQIILSNALCEGTFSTISRISAIVARYLFARHTIGVFCSGFSLVMFAFRGHCNTIIYVCAWQMLVLRQSIVHGYGRVIVSMNRNSCISFNRTSSEIEKENVGKISEGNSNYEKHIIKGQMYYRYVCINFALLLLFPLHIRITNSLKSCRIKCSLSSWVGKFSYNKQSWKTSCDNYKKNLSKFLSKQVSTCIFR